MFSGKPDLENQNQFGLIPEYTVVVFSLGVCHTYPFIQLRGWTGNKEMVRG